MKINRNALAAIQSVGVRARDVTNDTVTRWFADALGQYVTETRPDDRQREERS